MAKEVRAQKKEEAAMLAEALLDAEVRMGELLATIPKATPNPKSKSAEVRITKEETIEALGFNQDQAERMQTIAARPDLVEQVKQEARDNAIGR